MDLVIGFILGILGSLLSWWAIARYLGPKVVISKSITVVPTDLHAWGRPQRFKVLNKRRRGISEVRAVARLRIKGLEAASLIYPNSRLAFEISLSSVDNCVDYIRGRDGWIFTLDPQQITSPYTVFLPTSIKEALAARTASMRDFLTLGDRAELEVFVSATDGYSGTRRTFSHTYLIDDIVQGYFSVESLEVVEANSDDPPPRKGH
ncbi:MAG TPA: hypothetical protein VG318_01370 [Actinomycetota bacterium]|nr:hypothetical protein [Actinomycetota bacterium]